MKLWTPHEYFRPHSKDTWFKWIKWDYRIIQLGPLKPSSPPLCCLNGPVSGDPVLSGLPPQRSSSCDEWARRAGRLGSSLQCEQTTFRSCRIEAKLVRRAARWDGENLCGWVHEHHGPVHTPTQLQTRARAHTHNLIITTIWLVQVIRLLWLCKQWWVWLSHTFPCRQDQHMLKLSGPEVYLDCCSWNQW